MDREGYKNVVGGFFSSPELGWFTEKSLLTHLSFDIAGVRRGVGACTRENGCA